MRHRSTFLRPRFLKADHGPPRVLIKIEVLDHNLPKLIKPVKIVITVIQKELKIS